MAEPNSSDRMEKIVSLCKRRGFIFQSSEIYGGLNGFWDYGPLGAELKRNIRDLWWRAYTQLRDDVVGLDASIIMHPKVWEASGHTTTFNDPMVDCMVCKKRFRLDQVEPQTGTVCAFVGAVSSQYFEQLVALIQQAPNRPAESVPFALEAIKRLAGAEAELASAQLLEQLGVAPDNADAVAILNGIRACLARTPPVSVLVPPKRHIDHARHKAQRFYQPWVGESCWPILGQAQPVTEDRTHCPEPDCGGQLTPPRMFNLMLKTFVGPVESEENVAYLRPETAQAIFAQFKNVLEVSRQKIPFGIAQIGKAFRNEINPRNFTFRSREFEQMEIEFFIRPDEVVQKVAGSVATYSPGMDLSRPQPNWGWELWHRHWVEQRVQWYESIGLGRDRLDLHWQTPDELAHYAKACVDIQYRFPFGLQELEGIAARGDFDLAQHQKFSGKSMEYFDEEARVRYIPHVIEPSAGVDRLALALLCEAYCEDEVPDEQGRPERRVVLRFHPRVAPIKVGVFPLLKNRPELVAKARAVRDLLRPHMTVFYDESGAIGRRYRRQDEIGTPFGVTIDFDTVGQDPRLRDTVTLRDRDTCRQERVKIDELVRLLLERIR
jgi:glycyl-tRNA synthetase